MSIFIGGGVTLALVACIGGFLHYRRERMLLHAERMKALELGKEWPDDPETAKVKATALARQARRAANPEVESKSPASQCYSTTGYVCATGFVFAFISGSSDSAAVGVAIGAATGAIGVTGLICGTILAAKATDPGGMVVHAKPRFDPEAL